MNKNKFPVWAIIIKKAGKKCSILQCVLFLVASFCFSFVFSFSSFFEFLAAKSYQTYFDYNVFEVKEHPSWKEDQKEFFFGISSFIMDSRIYLDDIHYSFLQLKPHFWEDKPRFVINTLLLKRLNQDKINTIVMYYKQEKKIEHTIGVVKEEQMFSSPTLYYYYPYFQNIIASKDEKELLYVCNTIDVTDKRFSVYPLYEKRSSTLPYLYNNAIKDYLTYHLIFDSLSTIVYGYFLLIMGYFMISSCLLMISLIYKDVRDLAILLNRGYTNWNLICIYSLPILLYSLLSLLLLFIDFSFLRGILISCLLQIISLLISFNYLKRKSLHELLKEDFLC